MADLGTHLLVNRIVGATLQSRVALGYLVAGALVPDLGSRVPRMVLQQMVEWGLLTPSQGSFRLILGLDFPHTPAGTLLVSLVVALLMPALLLPPKGRRSAAGLLYAGGLLHLGLDFCQQHLSPGYRYLYPFSAEPYELAWMSTEASLLALPLLVAVGWYLERLSTRSRRAPPRPSARVRSSKKPMP